MNSFIKNIDDFLWGTSIRQYENGSKPFFIVKKIRKEQGILRPVTQSSCSIAFIPVLEVLKPDNADNPRSRTDYEVQERHAAKPEQIPEHRNVQD